MQADLAQAELGEALRVAGEAEAALVVARGAPVVEGRRVAGDAPADCLNVLAGAYASWLPAAARAIERGERAVEVAEALRREANEEAASCKGALEAVEKLMDARRAEERLRSLRKAQIALESCVRPRSRPS
jgi:hypothetical protein